ncbi:MAG: high-potential iron-sulfur protein [Paraburkholderia sp.]|uniref:high-potential iron-sulfur protein n=1 Tax=Paraburkholderia sp. TaxID=1926495 RepID=UPI003C319859
MKTSRRSFILFSISAASSLALTRGASADAAQVSETDPKAQALGYKQVASTVDKTKFSNYVAGQNCSNCSLFQGKSTDAWGGCMLFGDKQVAATGWCSSYSNM